MSEHTQPVVWLGEAGAHRDEAARALSEWASARGVVLSAPTEAKAKAAADPGVAERVDRELVRAQEAVAAADADAAERALARADAIVRDHPETPAAPWLRAEVLRAWSSRWLRLEPHDEARAAAAWQEAAALDGGRVAGIGEKNVPPHARVRVSVSVDPRASVRIDGAVVRDHIELGPGEHALVATIDGHVTYASWVAIAGPTTIAVPATVASNPCTRESFATARRDGERVVAPNATCSAWLAAIPGDRPNSVLVARCERDTCAPLVEWRIQRGTGPLAVPQAPDRSKNAWPAWATWTLVGVGAAAAASVVLVASGVFESRPVEQRFVVGGARQE